MHLNILNRYDDTQTDRQMFKYKLKPMMRNVRIEVYSYFEQLWAVSSKLPLKVPLIHKKPKLVLKLAVKEIGNELKYLTYLQP